MTDQVDSLDIRLAQIIWGMKQPADGHEEEAMNTWIAEIKQVLKDEGWVSPENATKVQAMVNQMAQLANDAFQLPTIQYIKPNKAMTKAQNLMSGSQWYERFKAEMKKPDYIGMYEKEAIDLMARRAAGLVEPEGGE